MISADHVDSPPPNVRPTLRMVARVAGVSAMTVSRALRYHAEVAPDTRAHVERVATRMGYRPDPELAKLMQHLRASRMSSFHGSVCALTTVAPAAHNAYLAAIVSGARNRADLLGYGFQLMPIASPRENRRTLHRILRSRGVKGLLLLPLEEPLDMSDLLDWNEFSVVAATPSVIAPEVHRASPHHFANALMLCRQLHRRGFRRPGLVVSAVHDLRVNHAITAAYSWFMRFEAAGAVAPLIYDGPHPVGLDAWFAREEPDVLITSEDRNSNSFARMLGLTIPGVVGFVSTSTVPGSTHAGVDEHPEKIGATAVDVLAGMIQRGEKGVSEMPSTTLILGRWVDGASCPARPA